MVTTFASKGKLPSKLPDISQEIKEVFGKYFEATEDDRECADLFLKAWLNMQTRNGIGLYMEERCATSRISSKKQKG